jgi:hypothetical protein
MVNTKEALSMTTSHWQSALAFALGISMFLTAIAPPAAASAAETKLTVEDFAKVERKGGTVTTGVPFAKGALKDVAKLSVSVGGKKIPAQFIAICPWDDGSVRWAPSVIECNHLTNLYGYVGMMTKNDETLKKGESYLARAISGDNPAFCTGNGAWSKETAKRVRYGYLLQYAYWKQKTGGAH